MVKNNVLMDLMMVTNNVASKVSTSTTSRDVVATQKLSSPAPTENALKTVNTVMEKLNAPMDLMIAPNNAASEDTASTTLRFAVAIQRVSGDVLTVTASKKTIFVMVKKDGLMVLAVALDTSVAKEANLMQQLVAEVLDTVMINAQTNAK
jgi:hypothetical protein